MMIRGFLKTAAAAAAIAALPASAIAATPAASLSLSESVRAGAAMEEESNQFENITQYAIPVVIVIVIALALYFVIEDDGDSASV
jgi:hypothetical protein